MGRHRPRLSHNRFDAIAAPSDIASSFAQAMGQGAAAHQAVIARAMHVIIVAS